MSLLAILLLCLSVGALQVTTGSVEVNRCRHMGPDHQCLKVTGHCTFKVPRFGKRLCTPEEIKVSRHTRKHVTRCEMRLGNQHCTLNQNTNCSDIQFDYALKDDVNECVVTEYGNGSDSIGRRVLSVTMMTGLFATTLFLSLATI